MMAPNREPVPQMLNCMLTTVNELVAMTVDPKTYPTIAAEEITLYRIKTRLDMILTDIEARKTPPGFVRGKGPPW